MGMEEAIEFVYKYIKIHDHQSCDNNLIVVPCHTFHALGTT